VHLADFEKICQLYFDHRNAKRMLKIAEDELKFGVLTDERRIAVQNEVYQRGKKEIILKFKLLMYLHPYIVKQRHFRASASAHHSHNFRSPHTQSKKCSSWSK
jgi:hypothetical protein